MRKIGELNAGTKTFVLYYDTKSEYNRFRLYEKYWENYGTHRKLIEKYADLFSVTNYINEYVRENNIG